MRLIQLQPGDSARVIQIDRGYGLQWRLNRLGIHTGDVVTVEGRGALHGPLLVTVHGMRVALGRGVARRILVEPLAVSPASRRAPRRGRRGRHRGGPHG